MDMSGNSGDGVLVETVGSLLAIIANSVQDALRILMFADKRAWGSPEFEQLRLLEDTLEEAKRDFQELPVLVNGRFYYENDRNAESLRELRVLRTRFEEHSQTFKNWVRAGGPIDPDWATETRWLRREMHRAQCRVVRRIHDDLETSSVRPRCLGALIVRRSQQRHQSHSPPSQSHQPQHQQHAQRGIPTATTSASQPDPTPSSEIAACNATGLFQRLGPGSRDIAFVCDFCDGFLVWEDLRSMPSTRQRAASSPESTAENWAATGFTHPRSHEYSPISDSDVELQDGGGNANRTSNPGEAAARGPETEIQGQEKTILFPPVAIANHLPPEPGEWQAPLLCPLCDEYYYEEQGDGDMDQVRYTQDEHGFESVALLQEHLEWSHASLIPSLADVAPKSSSCRIM